ncbi:MAG: hypothetical protein WCS37_02455 [Chloroflexota bacterium]
MAENHDIAKITYEQFEQFLAGQKYQRWHVADNSYFETTHQPLTSAELMDAIDLNQPDIKWIYICSDNDDLNEMVSRVNWDEIPEINATELNNYRLQVYAGRDFLYFNGSFEEASSGIYNTLVPVELGEEW